MKKIVLIFVIIAIFKSSFGQLNPINNLEWNHWYICPNNYFILSWDLPDPSQDTLVGYNIYRETDLYRFQTENRLYHTEAGENCGLDFLCSNAFWIHITAIYNSTLQESIYNDSVFCTGILIGIEESKQSKFRLFPNPTTSNIKIDSDFNIDKIAIISQSGEVIEEYDQKIELDLSNLPKGVYFIKVYSDKGVMMNVVILE
ncbi:MAG: T9SS type A sorting domain-containing protein [Bacteroidales bacterium]|nr:T9SS type A sorting domain-containing protein [Lentimicrobiaceae bacterium]MDD5695803.1 T9SS type A sorting domain-containing protein [Bacteroidales bacterium]